MLTIKITPENSGAHASHMTHASVALPEGWAVVPPHLISTALQLLPWVKLTVEEGAVTAVKDNAQARDAWEAIPKPGPPPDQFAALQLALSELAEAQATLDIENKLAIAELAEALLGGEA